jgi:hypothetical protein
MAAIPAGLANAPQDRHRLDPELGHGGMARAYLPRGLEHNRQLALNVLRPELAAILDYDMQGHSMEVTLSWA